MPKHEIAKVLGERIRKLRKAKGITQEELAHMACLHSTYIGQLERGEKNATLDSINKVARALDISLEELFRFSIFSDKKQETMSQLLSELENIEEEDRSNLFMIMNILIDWNKQTTLKKKTTPE
ncbi:helix-turn-helix domain-containing protein [Radiobacillus sp. PE A8.2]|uniref:helix-turn-helix domain-containing protein n=1 Tax=Radiobacillus sp. PE A8.2 TaxID=3380349 RepID=UPI0038901712